MRFSAPKASSRDHGNLFHMTGGGTTKTRFVLENRRERGQTPGVLQGNPIRGGARPAQNLELMDPLMGGGWRGQKEEGGDGDGGTGGWTQEP